VSNYVVRQDGVYGQRDAECQHVVYLFLSRTSDWRVVGREYAGYWAERDRPNVLVRRSIDET